MILIKQRIRGSRRYSAILLFLIVSSLLKAQAPIDTVPAEFTLPGCISYALKNQPLVRQSAINEQITVKEIKISLSGWYPQVGFDAGLQHYIKVPENSSGIPTTSVNSSSGVLSATQAIYSNRLLFDAKSAGELRNQAAENTENIRINTYVNVTKAFFDVLLTQEQIKVLDEAIHRLQRNYDDAFSLYRNGLTDKIDYQRTEISLSNARAQKKSAGESLKAKYAFLKQLMGVVNEKQITVLYDTSAYEKEILVDTSKIPDYRKRVEYRQVESAMKLQGYDVSYYRWSVLPSVTAFYNYNTQYYNDSFQWLYNKAYPSSLAGLRLSIPLFEGMNRIHNLGRARLQYQSLELEMENLKNEISSEYIAALAAYTGNLNELRTAKKNIDLAKDIFNTVRFQYEKGIKAYLEVIVSETDLRTAELNYLNALFQVLSSKIDLEKAAGDIKTNI